MNEKHDLVEAKVVYRDKVRYVRLREAHMGMTVQFPGESRKWKVVGLSWYLNRTYPDLDLNLTRQ